MTKQLLLSLVLVSVVLVLGCSNKQSLSGTVTFSDDGSPVPTGMVLFHTPSHTARGAIMSGGTYTVGTDAMADGISKGTYHVTVHADEATTIETPTTITIVHRPLIHSRYGNPSTSGLTFTADGKTRTFDIVVDRHEPPQRRR